MLKAFFDESVNQNKTVITIGGIALSAARARKMAKAWSPILKEFSLTHFHMTDCAVNAPPYTGLAKGHADGLARRLIREIREHADVQIAHSINVQDYLNCALKISQETNIDWLNAFGGPYSFLTQLGVNAVGDWCDAIKYNELVTYYFEQGYSCQPEAHKFLSMIPSDRMMRMRLRYYTHVFIPKIGPTAHALLQAGDIIAWEWMRDRLEQFEREPIRPRRLSLSFLIKNRITRLEHLRETEILHRFRETYQYAMASAIKGSPPFKPFVRSEFDLLASLVGALQPIPYPLDYHNQPLR